MEFPYIRGMSAGKFQDHNHPFFLTHPENLETSSHEAALTYAAVDVSGVNLSISFGHH